MRLLRICIFLITLASSFEAQNKAKEVLLEVYETGVGMVEVRGRYLYLRVTSDGSVEYQVPGFNEQGPTSETKTYRLTEGEVEQLTKFLNQKEVVSVPGKQFKPDAPVIDHAVVLDIRLVSNRRVKNLKLTNFSPHLSKDPEKYPLALLELECRIRALRARRSYLMLGMDCILQR